MTMRQGRASRGSAKVKNSNTPKSISVALVAVLLVLGSAWTAVVVLRELMRLPEVPEFETQAQVGEPLTKKLVYMIADGLRYDYAIDPARAPNIARNMRDHTHGELIAGRITMTSAAVLAMATGQRGDFAEVITNLQAGRTRFDDVMNSARRAGLTTGLVGDIVWTQMVGSFEPQVHDDAAMSLEVDSSPQILAAAHALVEGGRLPNVLVVHFVATDHLGHAYGPASERFAAFLRRFDSDLERLLEALPADATVMFMSDHGATDTGAHGSDIPLVRRSPFFAYGLGIRGGIDLGVMDQVDIGPTVAALVGVRAPKHARGTVITQMLEVPPNRASELACHDAQRAIDFAAAMELHDAVKAMQQTRNACLDAAATPQARIQASRNAVKTLDRALDNVQSTRGLRGAALMAAALALLTGLLPLLARRVLPENQAMRTWRWTLGCLLMCATSVALTLHVERISPPWHNVTRAVLFSVSGISLLLGLLRPQCAVRLYQRFPELAWVLLPGALACSYTSNTQAMAWVVLLVSGVLVGFGLDAESRGGWLAGARRQASWGDLAILALSAAFLLPFAIQQQEPLPTWLGSHPRHLLAVDLAVASAWLLFVWRRTPGTRWWQPTAAIGLALGALLLRRVAPAWMGVGGILLLPAVSTAALMRGLPLLGIGAGLGGWALVSRDEEVLPLLACLAFAEIAGRTLSGRTAPYSRQRLPYAMFSSPWMAALMVTLLFCLAYLARVGLQRGLDFTSMDFGAGSFGDPRASGLRIASSLVWKYVAADLLLLAVFFRRAGSHDRRAVLVMFAGVTALRATTIALMLFVCRTSYWTGFRTLSDAGPALSLAIATAILLFADVLRNCQARGSLDEAGCAVIDAAGTFRPLGARDAH